MDVERAIAARVLTDHPREAARVVEELTAEEAAALLGRAKPRDAAALLAAMAPDAARLALAALPADGAASILDQLGAGAGALLLRGLPAESRAALLSKVSTGPARSLERLLSHAEGTAGAVMDPDVLALPEDLTADQAVKRVREAAQAARYNLYVIDRDQRLTGVVNQRELLLARPGAVIASFMQRRVHRLLEDADTVAVVSHPAWREVHSLPVVDRDGRYLGAVRYRAFRALEESLREQLPDSNVTVQALGDLFRTGASAMLEMLSAPDSDTGGSQHGR